MAFIEVRHMFFFSVHFFGQNMKKNNAVEFRGETTHTKYYLHHLVHPQSSTSRNHRHIAHPFQAVTCSALQLGH